MDSASGWSLQTSTSNSRRELLQQGAAALIVGASLAFPLPALAAATPTPADLEKLRKGHARVKYLLEHWNEETQVCGKMVMSDTERRQVVRTDGESRNVF
jgi:type II secretory pathway component PulM